VSVTDYVPDAERLRADVEALAAMTRDSAGPGERKAAAWAQGRLVECGVTDARVEHYRGRATNSWSFAAHSLVGLTAMRVGGVRGAALALLAAASLERDASGRRPWRRRWFGGGRGATAVGVIEPSVEPRSTVVLVAHLDAAKTGLAWHPALARAGAARRERTRRADPVMGLQAIGLLLAAATAALPRGSRLRCALGRPATLLNALAIAANLDIARSPTVPGANDDATGVAVALDVARALAQEPLEHTRVVIALVGSEESGMGGFHAFLAARPDLGDPQRTFVLGLDTLGCGTPILAAAEGAILTHRYRDEDLALVDEGAALAGEPSPQRWRIGGWTDPLLALTRGIPSTCLLSIGPGGSYTHYHVPSDLPEHVDWGSVQACAKIAAGTLRALDRR
jgi:hypothetical protein